MSIFTNFYNPPPDEIPIAGKPPIRLVDLEELIQTICQSGRACDHTRKQIKEFLQTKDMEIEPVFRWLQRFEIFCDCSLQNAYQHKMASSLNGVGRGFQVGVVLIQ